MVDIDKTKQSPSRTMYFDPLKRYKKPKYPIEDF